MRMVGLLLGAGILFVGIRWLTQKSNAIKKLQSRGDLPSIIPTALFETSTGITEYEQGDPSNPPKGFGKVDTVEVKIKK